MRIFCVLVAIWLVAYNSKPVVAQRFEVEFELDQPKIVDEKTVKIIGTTNLPAGTEVVVRTDLTVWPHIKAQVTTPHKLSLKSSTAPTGKAAVTPEGKFTVTLSEPHKFKTGKYRVAAQVWVHSYGVFGSSSPQPAEFYETVGQRGAFLFGQAIDRDMKLLSGQVAVNASGEFELRSDGVDKITRKERTKFRRYSKGLDDAYKMHTELQRRGIYARWTSKDDLRANRVVVDFGIRVRNMHKSIRSVETQEAYYLLTEAVNALDQVVYWSTGIVNPKPAKIDQAEKDYLAAKAKLDAFIAAIKRR